MIDFFFIAIYCFYQKYKFKIRVGLVHRCTEYLTRTELLGNFRNFQNVL